MYFKKNYDCSLPMCIFLEKIRVCIYVCVCVLNHAIIILIDRQEVCGTTVLILLEVHTTSTFLKIFFMPKHF